MAIKVLYETSEDGHTFDTREEAEEHEQALKFIAWCSERFKGGHMSGRFIGEEIATMWKIGPHKGIG